MRCLLYLLAFLLSPAVISAADSEMKRIAGKTVDREGNPVSYVDIAPKWRSTGSLPHQKMVVQTPERNGSGKSDYEGKFSFDMMANWWEGILAYDDDRSHAGVSVVKRNDAPQDLEIVMEGVCTVNMSPESANPQRPFNYANVSIYYRSGAARNYTMILSASGKKPRAYLPPGSYEAMYSAGSMFARVNQSFTIAPGQTQLDLPSVALPLIKWADQPGGKAIPLKFSHIRGLPEVTNWTLLRGQWVYLNFWAHWCGPCQRKMDRMVTWNEQNQDKSDRYKIIFIHASDAKDFAIVDEKMPGLAARHWKGKPFPFPMMLDANQEIARDYGVRSFPTGILVDPNGVIVTKPGGIEAFDDLRRRISGDFKGLDKAR